MSKKTAKIDKAIELLEKYLKERDRIPADLENELLALNDKIVEIGKMFTAIKDYSEQENKRMGNLETSFLAVNAEVVEIRKLLSPVSESNMPGAPTPRTMTTDPIGRLNLPERIKKMLHLHDDGCITNDFMPRVDWDEANRALKAQGYKWVSENKDSRWKPPR